MLSVVFRLRGNSFKSILYLASDPWINNFSKARLMELLIAKLKGDSVLKSERPNICLSHMDVTTKMLRINDTPDLDIKLREDINHTIDASTSHLQSFASSVVIDVAAIHGSVMLALNGVPAPL
jgi:hypothetical protein